MITQSLVLEPKFRDIHLTTSFNGYCEPGEAISSIFAWAVEFLVTKQEYKEIASPGSQWRVVFTYKKAGRAKMVPQTFL